MRIAVLPAERFPPGVDDAVLRARDEAIGVLRDAGATLVGIDSLNIDDTADAARPVHTTLLGAGIPIVEHLCDLDAVPTTG
jgi:kynurenine formamidase